MKNSMTLLAALLAIALAQSACRSRGRCCPPTTVRSAGEAPKFLFVQSGRSASLDGNLLTLHAINPTTAFFSDRPHRIAGHIATDVFVEGWTTGPNSFADNPPNATLSVLDQDKVDQVIMTLMDPAFDAGANTLTYRVKILSGTVPTEGSVVSLFIDDAVAHPRHPIVHGHIQNQYPGGRKHKIFHGEFNHSND